MDGKTIYRKTYRFSTTGSGSETTGADGASFDHIDNLISIDAVLNMANGERYPNGYTNPSAPSIQYFHLKFALWDGQRKVRYQTKSAGTVIMTVFYTKK